MDKDGKIESLIFNGKQFTKTPGGGFKDNNDPNPISGWKPAEVIKMEGLNKIQIRNVENIISDFNEPKKSASAGTAGTCEYGFVVNAGPSVLFADLGSERKSFFGGNITFIRGVTENFALGLDGSIHSRKFGSEKLTRSLIMIEGQRVIGDQGNCNINWIGDIHVLVGLVHEKYGTYKGNGFVFGGGGALVFKLSDQLGLKAQVDGLWTKWKGADKLNFDIRSNLGLQFSFGKRNQKSFSDKDGDGIADKFDQEDNTPKGCSVDTHGVARDTDGDGVPDCRDRELITPTYCQPVDEYGVGKCPIEN